MSPEYDFSSAMRVIFFAQTKDAAGTSELEVKLNGKLSLMQIWQALVAVRPALAPFQNSTRMARNGEYADETTIFNETDEVALIPPVSGG
jgi:molybdopterin converting factor subunit 1